MTEQDVSDLVSIVEQIVQADDVGDDVEVLKLNQGRFRAVIDYESDEFRLVDDGEEVLCGGLHAFRN